VQTFSQYFQVPNPIPIYNPPTPSAKPPIIGKDYIKVQWIDGTGDKTDVYDVLVNGNWTYNVVKRYINITNVTINTPVNVQVYAINRSWGRTNKNNTPLITNASIQTFLPSTPINTTAPGNKNLSWEAGLGNVTNYYNVSVNGVWSNGTTVTYNDTTELSPGTYTVSVYAVNSTNRITLNTTPLTLSSTIIAPTYMPPTPIDMTTPGSKNLSWAAGSGNGTDYYNVSVNGVWSNGSTVAYKDTTGLSQGKYTVSIYAVNSTNGITLNPAPLTLSATIIAPTYMPPTPTISNSSGINWILTQWESGTLGNETDVFDVKVNGIMVEMGTINKSYNATNLSVGNYSHVMVYAVNMTNNRSVNSTPGEMNTSILAPVLTTTYVYSSGGGSSGGSGGGGGGGIGTSEPYSNIYKYEIQEHEVFTTPISFKYTNPEIPVYEVMVTCNQSNIASIRIEVLKDTSKLVGMPSPGIVYKNINIWIDYKRIKNALIRFKVENSWISSNGLSSADIKIFRWNNNSREWIGLSTGVLNKDVKYTYFESHADSLSASFAISGIKEENVPSRTGSSINLAQVEIEQTENKPVSTKIPETPGFEIILSTVSILSMVYLLKRIKR
jgi:PGF-pre-PGF domain-containing protein